MPGTVKAEVRTYKEFREWRMGRPQVPAELSEVYDPSTEEVIAQVPFIERCGRRPRRKSSARRI